MNMDAQLSLLALSVVQVKCTCGGFYNQAAYPSGIIKHGRGRVSGLGGKELDTAGQHAFSC